MDDYKKLLHSLSQLRRTVNELQETQSDLQKLGMQVIQLMKNTIVFNNNINEEIVVPRISAISNQEAVAVVEGTIEEEGGDLTKRADQKQ